MKRYSLLLTGIAFLSMLHLNGQEVLDPQFTIQKKNPVTSVKDQYQSGTCWDFATTALIESEVIRINGIKDTAKYPDFSEIFVVSKSYQDRIVRYLRMEGKLSSGPGSLSPDYLHIVKDYGLVPQKDMPGKTELPQHRSMDKRIAAYMKDLNSNHAKMKEDWKSEFRAILDSALGPCPEKFEVDGVTYTPASYRDFLKINPDDYVTVSSYAFYPFYKPFIMEYPDNWRWDTAFNVPLDELVRIAYEAIDKGYTISWDADMSEPTWCKNGTAYMPVSQIPVTQESRDYAYNIKETVDDHLMQIYGTALDQFGNRYFVVKNSWGTYSGNYKGDWYASEQYYAAKTVAITLHKDALPKDIREKLDIR